MALPYYFQNFLPEDAISKANSGYLCLARIIKKYRGLFLLVLTFFFSFPPQHKWGVSVVQVRQITGFESG